MKPIIGAVGVLLAGLGGAIAADLPVPGPAPVPPAYYPGYYNWSGVYVGVNAGGGFGSSSWADVPPGAASPISTGSFNISGALAGATLGVNYQTGPYLVGFEGDIDWSGVRGNSSAAACGALGPGVIPATSTCQTNIVWLGTARARIGYAFDRVLVFASGGAAFDGRQAVITGGFATTNLPPQLGWTVGAGVEYAFTDAISAKVEYLFANLGTNSCPTAAGCGATPAAGANTASLSVPSMNIVRAGVNYRFSW